MLMLGGAVNRRVVDEDERELAASQPVDAGRLRVARIDERAVHRHVACRDDVAASRRQQREREAARFELVGDGPEKGGGHLVGERVA